MLPKKVFLGWDHAGVSLATSVVSFLHSKGVDVTSVSSSESEDYTDVAKKVASQVASNGSFVGILICGSGVGVSIVANKVKGVRAALCHTPIVAKLSRNHNNANVLCLGARVLDVPYQIEIVEIFLDSEFEGERHKARVEKIELP